LSFHLVSLALVGSLWYLGRLPVGKPEE